MHISPQHALHGLSVVCHIRTLLGSLTSRVRGDLGSNPQQKHAIENCCCQLVNKNDDSAIPHYIKLPWFLLQFITQQSTQWLENLKLDCHCTFLNIHKITLLALIFFTKQILKHH